MTWHHDFGVQALGTRKGGVKVVDFKPQEHAVSVWPDGGVPDAAVIVLHVPPVQLENQPAVGHEPVVLGATVAAAAAKETLIPAAARLDIGYADEGL